MQVVTVNLLYFRTLNADFSKRGKVQSDWFNVFIAVLGEEIPLNHKIDSWMRYGKVLTKNVPCVKDQKRKIN